MTTSKIAGRSTRLMAGFLLSLLTSAALAQSGTVANHAVPIGKGPGVTGFGAAVPGTAGGVLTSQGPSTDPAFLALPNPPAVPGFATIAQYLAGVSPSTIIPPAIIYPAETTTAFGATVALDFSTFINTNITLTGNVTTMNVANVAAGKAGTIAFTQSGAGSFTTVFNSIFKFSGGAAPALTTGSATAVDILSYSCRSATNCPATLLKDVR